MSNRRTAAGGVHEGSMGRSLEDARCRHVEPGSWFRGFTRVGLSKGCLSQEPSESLVGGDRASSARLPCLAVQIIPHDARQVGREEIQTGDVPIDPGQHHPQSARLGQLAEQTGFASQMKVPFVERQWIWQGSHSLREDDDLTLQTPGKGICIEDTLAGVLCAGRRRPLEMTIQTPLPQQQSSGNRCSNCRRERQPRMAKQHRRQHLGSRQWWPGVDHFGNDLPPNEQSFTRNPAHGQLPLWSGELRPQD
ncbi:MAG: hypothetical protein QOI66_1132 [Myxococcales bacterium]|nr:hypothetical protein [Myxococcales bacterium]